MLDANILGPLCHHPERHRAINAWFARVVANPRHHPLLPELADYEVRRGLLHLKSQSGLERLNSLVHALEYVPLDTATMRRAAGFWAEARGRGRPSGAGLDADAILAAQAFGADATLITDNARHFAHYPVRALRWRDVD
jgi:predicted nucleic acid-binding protein